MVLSTIWLKCTSPIMNPGLISSDTESLSMSYLRASKLQRKKMSDGQRRSWQRRRKHPSPNVGGQSSKGVACFVEDRFIKWFPSIVAGARWAGTTRESISTHIHGIVPPSRRATGRLSTGYPRPGGYTWQLMRLDPENPANEKSKQAMSGLRRYKGGIFSLHTTKKRD